VTSVVTGDESEESEDELDPESLDDELEPLLLDGASTGCGT